MKSGSHTRDQKSDAVQNNVNMQYTSAHQGSMSFQSSPFKKGSHAIYQTQQAKNSQH